MIDLRLPSPATGRRTFPMRAALALALVLSPAPLLAQGAPGAGAPPAVNVEQVKLGDVTEQQVFTGRIEAAESVEIRARVQGYLGPRQFEEGAEVEKGQVLFTIGAASYEAAVSQAEAAVQNARAALELANLSYERQQTLRERNTGSQASLDEARANRDQAEATLRQNEASLKLAQLDLGYTKITAPISGRIGVAAFSEGAFIGPDSGALARIVQQDPMRVAFPVPQRRLINIGQTEKQRNDVVIKLRLADGSIYDQQGEILFTNIEANEGTDSVMVRAGVANPDRVLYDKQLVDVIVAARKPEEKLLMPQSAMLIDQQGTYTLIVNDENKVEQRRIETGEQRGPAIVVTEGLEAGDRVIVAGQQKAQPGMQVAPQDVTPDEQASTAAPSTNK
ncbi:membrane fusion protein (multidrug efflux system) [Rhodopseudomonas julia]|uniref:Membrane fusion protein (Multidrug efflux system) n=1 Tax=Rhodopseudomonas julia TaxID=200617 RepID=A0ABU0C995_9BRAD|nr:efflux RND transporter periplasmic adaptor subunit [Rhodopseudomonas julia]MDQ0327102.1 membrane fusion protein (multidrug efflux system) [Rhodopseudomonas julia]